MCPVRSSGSPHNGHGGRPAASTRRARSTNARASPGSMRTRSVVRAVLDVFEQRFLRNVSVLNRRLRLDDDQLGIAVPNQSPLRRRGNSSSTGCSSASLSRCADAATSVPVRATTSSSNCSMRSARMDTCCFSNRDRNHPHAIDGLQVKRAFARHANGPRDESTRAIKLVELAGHSAIQPIRRECAPQRRQLRPSSLHSECSQYRSGSPSDGRFRPLRRRGAGAGAVRSPPMSLLRTTSGRAAAYRIADTEHGSTAMR